jgi:hypothetical protein
MKRNVLVSSVLGVALAGLMVTGAAAQSPTVPRSNKGGQDVGNVGDERAAQVHNLNAAKKKPKKEKKDKDRDPSKSLNKTKGSHKATGHRH